MPRQIETDGIILDRELAGERHVRLTVLSPSLGLIIVMARESRPSGTVSSKNKTQRGGGQKPDIFDLASMRIQIPEDSGTHPRVYFLAEYKVLRRHAGLGKKYSALEAAAALSKLITRNAAHFETCAPVFELCAKAFDALDVGANPEAVRLKAAYLLARAEGFPAREQWMAELSKDDQALAKEVINRPANEAKCDAKLLMRLRQNLERWLAGHTDLELE